MQALHNLFAYKQCLPPIEYTNSHFYNILKNANSLQEVTKLIEDAPAEIKKYVRVVTNHEWPLFHWKRLVDEYSVPIIQLSEITQERSTAIDPLGIYFIEVAISGDRFEPQIVQFADSKNFIACVACDSEGVVPESYRDIDARSVLESFMNVTVVRLLNSFIYLDLPKDTYLSMSDVSISPATILCFSNISSLELNRCTLPNEVQVLELSGTSVIRVYNCPQVTLESIKKLFTSSQISTFSYYNDMRLPSKSVQRFKEEYEEDNNVPPQTYTYDNMVWDGTVSHPSIISHLMHASRVSNMRISPHIQDRYKTEDGSRTKFTLVLSTMPIDFFEMPDVLARPVIDGVSRSGDLQELELSLNVYGIFPKITNWNCAIDILEVMDSQCGDYDIFKHFGADVYGGLFDNVKELSWKADPAYLHNIQSDMLQSVEKLTLLVRNKVDVGVINKLEIGSTMKKLTLNVETKGGDFPLPLCPGIENLTVSFKTSVYKAEVSARVSKKYPSLKSLNVLSLYKVL